jgi:hypothetical protein
VALRRRLRRARLRFRTRHRLRVALGGLRFEEVVDLVFKPRDGIFADIDMQRNFPAASIEQDARGTMNSRALMAW